MSLKTDIRLDINSTKKSPQKNRVIGKFLKKKGGDFSIISDLPRH